MLIYHRTNLLNSNAQTLVNTVNCVGVMGKGIALDFKLRYPDMFRAYKRVCDAHQLEVGKLLLWQGPDHWVLNFPTKKHWRYPSRIEWIEAGLEKFVGEYSRRGITDVSFPRLGCGNGGLKWEAVRPVMERYLANLPINVFVHDYNKPVGLPEHLEHIAKQLHSSVPAASTFEDFVESVRRAICAADGKLVTLASRRAFQATLRPDDALEVATPDGSYLIEREDLRALWIALSNGLVTREQARWSAADAAEQVLSVISVVPGVRPVEIQRRNASTAEIALELESRKTATKVEQPSPQPRFEWA